MLNYEKLRQVDTEHHLHPFTHHRDMHKTGTHIIQSAEGVYLIDENGKKILDALAGLWCVNIGYGRKEMTDAVAKQMNQLAYYPSFFNTTTEPTILLAEKVTSLAPERLKYVFFSNSGSEAVETALKLIRGYHKAKKQSSRQKIMTLTWAYHGVTVAATSMTHIPTCQDPFDLPLPGYIKIPGPYHYAADTTLSAQEYGQWCIEETEKIILREGPETIAATFVEPIQGAGGVIVPPEGYLSSLRQLCKKYGILYVSDEVICAFGRVGEWFAAQKFNLDPDLITTAKGITSGYIPLGATLVSKEIGDTLNDNGYLATGGTYSGHPTACAAALKNIEIMERENLIPRVREDIGPYFQKRLAEFASHPAVGEVRGLGLVGAMELVPRGGKSARSASAPLGPKALLIGREEGLAVRGIRDILAVAPPLTMTHAQVDEMISGIGRILNRIWD